MEQKVVEDILLVDFYEKKFEATLLLPKQQISTKKYFPDIDQEMINVFEPSMEVANFEYLDGLNCALELGEGKLFLCGLACDEILGEETFPETLDLYFCNCNISEMNTIISKILEYIEDYSMETTDEKVLVTTDRIYDDLQDQTLVFHLINYKSPEDILRDITDKRTRHCWSPKSGYSCTIMTGLLLSLELSDGHAMTPQQYNEEEQKVDIVKLLLNSFINSKRFIEMYNKDILLLILHTWLKLLVLSVKDKFIVERS